MKRSVPHLRAILAVADTLVHFSAWSSLERARAFFESEELVAIRKRAGVKSPEFLYLEEIERGVL